MGADEEKRIKLNSSLVSRPIIRFSPPSAVQTPILPSSQIYSAKKETEELEYPHSTARELCAAMPPQFV